MLTNTVVPGGRRIRADRRFFAHCLFCEARLDCPPDVVPWGWVRTEAAQAFVREHHAHGFPRMVGFEFTAIEYEPEAEDVNLPP